MKIRKFAMRTEQSQPEDYWDFYSTLDGVETVHWGYLTRKHAALAVETAKLVARLIAEDDKDAAPVVAIEDVPESDRRYVCLKLSDCRIWHRTGPFDFATQVVTNTLPLETFAGPVAELDVGGVFEHDAVVLIRIY